MWVICCLLVGCLLAGVCVSPIGRVAVRCVDWLCVGRVLVAGVCWLCLVRLWVGRCACRAPRVFWCVAARWISVVCGVCLACIVFVGCVCTGCRLVCWFGCVCARVLVVLICCIPRAPGCLVVHSLFCCGCCGRWCCCSCWCRLFVVGRWLPASVRRWSVLCVLSVGWLLFVDCSLCVLVGCMCAGWLVGRLAGRPVGRLDG